MLERITLLSGSVFLIKSWVKAIFGHIEGFHKKNSLYILGSPKIIHNARKRGKALLHSLIGLLVK